MAHRMTLRSGTNRAAEAEAEVEEPSSSNTDEFVPAPDIGEGWTRQRVPRGSGMTAAPFVIHYRSTSTPRVFHSLSAVRNFQLLRSENIPSSLDRSRGHLYPTRGPQQSTESILFRTFQVCDGDQQSDPSGSGVIAKVDVNIGDSFEDKAAFWMDGEPPSYLNPIRGEYIMYRAGFFNVQGSYTVMLNEPRNGQTANMQFRVCRTFHDGGILLTLRWRFIRDVQAGNEILVHYYQIIS